MKALAGIKHIKKENPFAKFGLIFWDMDTPSQNLTFTDEEKCNKILNEVIAGEGLTLTYDWESTTKRVYPHRIIKIAFIEEHTLYDNITDEVRNAISQENNITSNTMIGRLEE